MISQAEHECLSETEYQKPEMLLIPSGRYRYRQEQRVITVDDEGKFVPKRIHVLHESQQSASAPA